MRPRGVQLSTVVFALLILAGVAVIVFASFGPVKLLGAGAIVVAVIALRTEQRRTRAQR